MACRLYKIMVVGDLFQIGWRGKESEHTVKAPGTEKSTTFLFLHSSVLRGIARNR